MLRTFVICCSLLFLVSLGLAQEAPRGGCHQDAGAAPPTTDPDIPLQVPTGYEAVSLLGHIVCLHCDLRITETCDKALQIADGTIVRLIPNEGKEALEAELASHTGCNEAEGSGSGGCQHEQGAQQPQGGCPHQQGAQQQPQSGGCGGGGCQHGQTQQQPQGGEGAGGSCGRQGVCQRIREGLMFRVHGFNVSYHGEQYFFIVSYDLIQ